VGHAGGGGGHRDRAGRRTREWGTPGDDPFPAGGEVRLCVYRVPASEQGTAKPAGEFEHGGILRSDRWAPIATAVLAAGPAERCSAPAGRFAVLRRADGLGVGIYVELDGCQRILTLTLTGRTVLAQGNAELVELLDSQD